MNVIIANEQKDVLSNLDIDIIKNISGEYEASEIVEMFKSFFYNRMILDVTAVKNYKNIDSYKTIASGLDVDKIIFFLPKGSEVCTSNFLSNLVSSGVYNFTTNVEGIKYLLDNPNTYENVSSLKKEETVAVKNEMGIAKVIGFKDVTEHAGATSLIYMLQQELKSQLNSRVVAIEAGKNDFSYFNGKDMKSVATEDIRNEVYKYSSDSIVLVDLNKTQDDSFCGEVIYLMEPSILKLNKLMSAGGHTLSKLNNKKVVLNKSLLNNKDINDFEYEAKLKIFYNIPPLNDRSKNSVLSDFLGKLGLLDIEKDKNVNNNKVFGLFRR